VTQVTSQSDRPDGAGRRETPWRRGLLLTLRERLEKQSYDVPSDAVAASIIDRATRGGAQEH
jgi:hypothetical protein